MVKFFSKLSMKFWDWLYEFFELTPPSSANRITPEKLLEIRQKIYGASRLPPGTKGPLGSEGNGGGRDDSGGKATDISPGVK
jgi:hypothetical protein